MIDEETIQRYPITTLSAVAIVGFACTALAIYGASSNPAPSKTALSVTSGLITSSGPANPRTEDITFRLEGSDKEYRYLDWYPHFDQAQTQLAVGTPISVYTAADSDAIWQVEFQNRELVSFDEMVAARSRNSRYALILAVALPIMTIASIISLWNHIRKSRRRFEGANKNRYD